MNPRKLSLGLQIIALLLLIQAASSWKQKVDMHTLQGTIQDHFAQGCKGLLLKRHYKNDVEYIASLPETGYWNLDKDPIKNNGNNISSMTFETVQVQGQFEFPNGNKEKRQVSGLLATPDMDGPLKGIVIYFHGTFFSKNEAPSSQTYPIYQGIASIFGARKYAVLFPDYLGYGADEDNVHPYVLYPQQNILTATYLLNLVAPSLNKKFKNVNKNNPLPLMSTGYSEGGAYGVFFGACNTASLSNNLTQCNKVPLSDAYKVVAISGSEGAYDTAGVVKNFLLQRVTVEGNNNPFKAVLQPTVNLGKPGLSALAIYSYATYNPQPFQLSEALIKGFYEMNCAISNKCQIDGKKMNIKQALSLKSAGPKGSASIVSAIYFSAIGKENNGQAYLPGLQLLGDQNSLRALINQSIILTEHFDAALAESTITDYGNHAPFPVFVFSLNYDSMVSPVNTQNLLKKNSSQQIHSYFMDNSKFKTCANGLVAVDVDHIGAYIVSHVFVLKFFEDIVDGLKSKTSEEL